MNLISCCWTCIWNVFSYFNTLIADLCFQRIKILYFGKILLEEQSIVEYLKQQNKKKTFLEYLPNYLGFDIIQLWIPLNEQFFFPLIIFMETVNPYWRNAISFKIPLIIIFKNEKPFTTDTQLVHCRKVCRFRYLI